MRASLRTRALSSGREGKADRLPARKSVQTRPRAEEKLAQTICRAAKSLFNCQGASYWELNGEGRISLQHSEGQPAFSKTKTQLLSNLVSQLEHALASGSPTVLDRKDLETFRISANVQMRSCLMLPLSLSPHANGFLVLIHQKIQNFFGRRVAEQANAIAAALRDLLNATSSRPRSESHALRAQSLVNLAVELKPSLRLAEFAGRFTQRAGEMLGARMAILALDRGPRLETIVVQDSNNEGNRTLSPSFDAAMNELAATHRESILNGSAHELLGQKLANIVGWQNLCFVRLTGRDGELLGALCLVDHNRELRETDRNLIEALAGHASVALENSRLFSRIEQSKRQWVEDVDAISDLIVAHDAENRILRVNRSMAEAVGSRPSELVGKSTSSLGQFAADTSGRPCPFCRERKEAGEESILIAGARAYLISTSRIGAGAEEGSRTIHVLKDVTEQRSSRAQLQRERDFNTKILNHTQNMILVLDTAGLISYANRRCYEAGFRKDELLGRPLRDFVGRDRGAILENAFQYALEGLASENVELTILRGNRSRGKYSVSLSPMRDEQGQVNSVVVVMTDITDAAVLQAQLRHSEKMAALGQLVSGVAHEINNPLAAIVGYSDLLLENAQIPESSKEELNIILKEGERAKEIVQNLLHFARQMPSRREPLDVGAILKQVVELRTYGAANNGVEVIRHANANVPQIDGDAQQLQQVFLNVLNNAYDAISETGRAGRIEIQTSKRNGCVEISIRDNGTGVSDLERIFEPFYTTKEVGKGTGLGLSICYGIVREHGGEILCANNPDGPGCTFVLRFPVAGAAAAISGVAGKR